MSKKIIPLLILLLFVAGCTTNSPDTDNQQNTQTNLAPASGNSQNAPNTADENTDGPISEEAQCYGEEIHPIGQSIAELYPEITDYNQVMTWFCTGFEFEDIITALETQMDTDVPAADLLTMFQNGQTWDEIWVELGVVGN